MGSHWAYGRVMITQRNKNSGDNYDSHRLKGGTILGIISCRHHDSHRLRRGTIMWAPPNNKFNPSKILSYSRLSLHHF